MNYLMPPRPHWLGSLPRVFVGLILLSTGFGKLLDIPGFIPVLDAYQLMPHSVSVVLAFSLPLIELATGFGLLLSTRPIIPAWTAVALHLLMLTAVIITLQRGIQIDNCGCFGVFLARPLSFQTFIEDLAMLAFSILALILAYTRKTGSSTDTPDEL